MPASIDIARPKKQGGILDAIAQAGSIAGTVVGAANGVSALADRLIAAPPVPGLGNVPEDAPIQGGGLSGDVGSAITRRAKSLKDIGLGSPSRRIF